MESIKLKERGRKNERKKKKNGCAKIRTTRFTTHKFGEATIAPVRAGFDTMNGPIARLALTDVSPNARVT